MKSIFSIFKQPYLMILIIILLIGFFFRTYQVVERFDYAHDADLFSWIVKDIVVDHHLRLIGQLTSAPGIFIGPLFYYLIIPFFLLTNMDPVGAIVPITIFGVLTILSYYFVFTKLFNSKIGLIVSFLYATLLSPVVFDRRIAPSTPTNLWVIWYFYTVIMLARGNFSVLPILAVLIALIWHLHIALLPSLLAIPIAFLVSKKLPKLNETTKFATILFVVSLPLILFELRHNFGQTQALINNFTTTHEGTSGLYKFQQVLEMITKNINALLFSPQSFSLTRNVIFIFLILLSALFLVRKKLLSFKELVPLYIWILGIIFFFSLSSSLISEYYFYNIEIIFLMIVSFWLFILFKSSTLGKILTLIILLIIFLKNAHFFITQDYYHKGYYEKKAVVDYIISDASSKNFPCFSISYITTPGENVGFRYFFYLKNSHLVHPGTGAPVYNIVIPEELSNEVQIKFAHIGVIPPSEIPSKDVYNKACRGPNTNLTDPMFGFVD